jgi:hypothetical protein
MLQRSIPNSASHRRFRTFIVQRTMRMQSMWRGLPRFTVIFSLQTGRPVLP